MLRGIFCPLLSALCGASAPTINHHPFPQISPLSASPHHSHESAGYSNGVLKVGSYVLAALLLFAAVFALLPAASSPKAETGATLRGVEMTFYPASDPDAYWTFAADTVQNDPLSGETLLDTLSEGGRWVRVRDEAGNLTGEKKLDATLDADALTIDRGDNMTMQAASITLLEECATIDLTGSAERPVRVEQNVGFSAPKADVVSPFLQASIPDLSMTFEFVITEAGEGQTSLDTEAELTCPDI